MSPGVRQRVVAGLVGMAGVLLVLTALVGYVRATVIDPEQFADRATATLRDPAVRTLVAERVTDDIVLARESELLAARPLLVGVTSGLVGGNAFGSLFHRAALDVHRAIFEHDENTISLTLVDVGTVAGEALRTFRPQLADEVERVGDVPVLRQRVGGVTADLARFGDRVRVLTWLLGALTIATLVAAVVVSRNHRATASHLAVATIVAGVVLVIAYYVVRVVLLAQIDDPDERAAASAVYREFLADLRNLGFVLAAAGAIIAAAASSLIDPDTFEEPVTRAWRVVRTEPQRAWLRVLRAIAFVALGAVVVAEPSTALTIVAILAGLLLIQQGAEILLRLVYRPEETRPEAPVERHSWRNTLVLGGAATAIAAAIIAVFLATGGVEAPQAAVRGCNGSDALCSKRLDEVTLPATHNSMSVPLPGWYSSEQDAPIAAQLADGVRGLLVDTHYATKLEKGRYRTEFGGPEALREAVKDSDLSDSSIEAALRLRDRLGYRGEGERGMYLCHSFCELGATSLDSVLTDLHAFLVTHPTDVVVVVNQDYVTPADFVGAVRKAGLEPMVYTPDAAKPMPTLQEMIDADHRVLFMAENHAGAAPWYQLAYDRLTEETPYAFPKASLLTDPSAIPASCEPNRGPERAPFFLVNHWVTTDPVPRPSDARKVNAYTPLLRRAQECARIRDHAVNLLAVNFYRQGDLFRVVDTLNGV